MDKRVEEYLEECRLDAMTRIEENFEIYRDTMEKMTPIEALMYIAMRNVLIDDYIHHSIQPQQKIGRYKVDFFITAEWGSSPHWHSGKYDLIVECDGHDFHEKTKEQARTDKVRDRTLLMLGYSVMRFTGSEIWKDPFDCASQVSHLVYKNTPK